MRFAFAVLLVRCVGASGLASSQGLDSCLTEGSTATFTFSDGSTGTNAYQNGVTCVWGFEATGPCVEIDVTFLRSEAPHDNIVSIPQVNRSSQRLAVASLPTFASCCNVFVVVAPDATHADTGCVCDSKTFRRRAWINYTRRLFSGRGPRTTCRRGLCSAISSLPAWPRGTRGTPARRRTCAATRRGLLARRRCGTRIRRRRRRNGRYSARRRRGCSRRPRCSEACRR